MAFYGVNIDIKDVEVKDHEITKLVLNDDGKEQEVELAVNKTIKLYEFSDGERLPAYFYATSENPKEGDIAYRFNGEESLVFGRGAKGELIAGDSSAFKTDRVIEVK